MKNRFLDLIAKNKGFEITLGFVDFVDHFIGGTGNTVWYLIDFGRYQELWMGECADGSWTDKHYVIKKSVSEEAAPSGTTIAKIAERLYYGQDKIAADGRKPVATEIHGEKCSHYTYSFGAYAYDILDEYGVTCSYSDVDNVKAGFRFRDVKIGEAVNIPKLN